MLVFATLDQHHRNPTYLQLNSPYLTKCLHRQLNRRKRTRTNRRSPQKRRPNAPPETTQTLLPKRLRKSIPHALIPLLLPKPIRLHLRLDHVKRIRAQPQRFTSQRTIARNLPRRNLFALYVVARRVAVHHVLERQEPRAVGLRFADQRDGGSAVEAFCHARRRGEFADAVDGPGVQASRAVGLRLQADADVLDGAGEERVGQTGESSRGVVLSIAHGLASGGVLRFEGAAGIVVGAELHGHASADSDQGGEGSFVESRGAFFFEDLRGAVGRAGVVGGGLQADFDDVEGLADEDLGDAADGAGEEVFEGLVHADVGFL
jgi:hypothetical protein